MFGPINVNREGMTTVYRTAGLMQAEIIKGRLESAGIPVMLDYESLGRVMGITVDGLGEVRILVPNERADEAKELLAPSADDEQVAEEE
jgi:Putative prokaryotic signal transducing protein